MVTTKIHCEISIYQQLRVEPLLNSRKNGWFAEMVKEYH